MTCIKKQCMTETREQQFVGQPIQTTQIKR